MLFLVLSAQDGSKASAEKISAVCELLCSLKNQITKKEINIIRWQMQIHFQLEKIKQIK